MDSFRDAVCLVTGAGSGIGKAAAEILIAHGARVLANDLSVERLADLIELGATPAPGDVSEAGTIEELAAAANAAGVTHLVNAAGILESRPLPEVDREMYDRIFAVNARSVFFLCQAICPLLPRGGSVVNVSSSSAKTGTTLEVAVYAATKAAVLSMTRAFAFQYAGDGVRVNAVCPGIIDTPMQDKLLEGVAAERGISVERLGEERNKMVPLGRPGSPEECAEVMAFLLSDSASYMTGQAINISGGQITW